MKKEEIKQADKKNLFNLVCPCPKCEHIDWKQQKINQKLVTILGCADEKKSLGDPEEYLKRKIKDYYRLSKCGAGGELTIKNIRIEGETIHADVHFEFNDHFEKEVKFIEEI